MADISLRDELIAKIRALSDEQVRAALQAVEAIQAEQERPPYNEVDDPTIGMISGPTDLSRRHKQILRDEIDPRSGWTLKDKLE